MYNKGKPMKVTIKCGRKRADKHGSRRSGFRKVDTKSGKVLNHPSDFTVVKPNGKRIVYSWMYDQEAKDIQQAMTVLAKFARD